ncbi:MAG: nucleoside hydrolase [Alistipes sp.]|nr:nucleoside hydrolase [Alistipes sp.]
MRHWYGYKKMPIGVNTACVTDMDCVDYCTKVCKLTNEEGEPLFKRSKNPKYEEAVEMYRRILSKQDDKSVVIITVGFSTTMAQLLQSQPDKYSPLTGEELVAKKVKYFSIMAGEFVRKNYREYNVWNDLEASKYFFDKSPIPMVIVPWTLGDQIQYPGSSIANDFEWAAANPMVEGYKAYMQMTYDRPTWDVISAFYACHPDHKAFTLSNKGEVKVVGKGVTEWRDDANGRYQILVPSEAQRQQILDYFIEILTTKPKKMK